MSKTSLIIFSYLLLHLSVNVQTFEIENIIGGLQASISDFPYQAFVHTSTRDCSGVIVHEWYVITAAHCIMDINGKVGKVRVAAGVNNLKDLKYRFYANATTAHFHEDYTHEMITKIFQGDIAVLKLEKMIPLDNLYMKKISLPKPFTVDNLELFVNTEPVITGYGYNEISISLSEDDKVVVTGNKTGELNFAITRVMSIEECSKFPPYQSVNFMKVFCSRMKQYRGISTRGTCLGDSGGPLVLKKDGEDILIGILSNGPIDCNERIIPSIYTKVSYYRNFIDRVITETYNERQICRYDNPQNRCLIL